MVGQKGAIKLHGGRIMHMFVVLPITSKFGGGAAAQPCAAATANPPNSKQDTLLNCPLVFGAVRV
jgi:hypothetical protein